MAAGLPVIVGVGMNHSPSIARRRAGRHPFAADADPGPLKR